MTIYEEPSLGAESRERGADWTPREIELLDGMIEVQKAHAARCDGIANMIMAEKQKGWDLERVALLERIKAAARKPESAEGKVYFQPHIDLLEAFAEKAESEVKALREALTPSDATKGEYSGEFSFNIPETREYGEEFSRNVLVPWTTVKTIMAAILARAALAPREDKV